MKNINIALIPAYMPDEKLIKLVDDLNKENFKIVVVDDGSGSNYDNIFNNIKETCDLIRYDVNKGKGYALKKGIKYIGEKYKENYIIVTMDCDGQHTVRDAKKLCDLASINKDTLYCGKRLRSKKTPLRSRFGNTVTRLVYNIAAKIDIYDTQTGLRAFSNKLTDYMLKIKGDRYEYEMNVLLYLSCNNIKVKEEKIETIYFDNNKKSHFKTFTDSYKVYSQIIKFSFISIISYLINFILYIIFNIFMNALISNVLSTLIGKIYNYVFNKNIKKEGFIKYIILSILVLFFNTLLLHLFVNKLLINKFTAKILIDIISYFTVFIINILIKKEK